MSLLDQDKVKMLEQEFKADERGLKLDSFVWLFLTVLTYPSEEKVDVINGIIKLFFDIDINGDGRLEWKEFNQYVIDQVATTQGLPAMIEEGSCIYESRGRRTEDPRRCGNYPESLPAVHQELRPSTQAG